MKKIDFSKVTKVVAHNSADGIMSAIVAKAYIPHEMCSGCR